tara:strand:- start:4160 stop:4720 length:561 start_codon:yes stop_codon:yes gene_type:complete
VEILHHFIRPFSEHQEKKIIDNSKVGFQVMDILFPESANNEFKGHKLAIWLLYFYIFKSFFAGLVHMLASDGGAQSIGSVSLDSFTQGGADSVVTMFGLWGMEHFVIGLIALVLLLRYKSLIPLIWGIYAVEYTGRALSHTFTPGLVTDHTPPGVMVDNILVPLSIMILIFSIYTTKKNEEIGSEI